MPPKNTDKDIELMPTTPPSLIPDAVPISPEDTPADSVAIKALKYRFWLSFFALFMSGIFGLLSLLSVAAGYALANEMQGGDPSELVLSFKIMTSIFITLAPTCIWVAYKLRPGGN